MNSSHKQNTFYDKKSGDQNSIAIVIGAGASGLAAG